MRQAQPDERERVFERRNLLKAAAVSPMLAAPAAAAPSAAAAATPAPDRHEPGRGEERMSNGAFSEPRLRRLNEVMADYVARGEVPGLVAAVWRKGELHIEALGRQALDGPPMRRDSIFRIASISKPITAAAAMILVEECRLRLDDPVDPWLPELADRKVLRRLDSPLEDTVPARRPISLRDLLTLRFGLGAIMIFPSRHPIQKAMEAAGVAPGPLLFDEPADAFMRRLGSLPLAFQPGERWLYDTGADVLGVLIARVAGESLGRFLKARLFEPLGMKDTGFHVPPGKLHRLVTAYRGEPSGQGLAVFDAAEGGRFASPPAFEAGGGGLVSTAEDYLAFQRMLLNGGRHGRERILSRASVALMCMDHLDAAQKQGSEWFFGAHSGWGFGMAVAIARDQIWRAPGRFGWDGGYGTSAYVDPAENLAGVLMTQRMMTSPSPPPVYRDFWTLAYQAIGDAP